MKIVSSDLDKKIVLNTETNFGTDLGWEDSIQLFEKETLKSLINPVENYETVRFTHKPYVSINDIEQTDIWFYFYFYNPNQTHLGGLNYEYAGLLPNENQRLLRQTSESFFRLEFYKVPDGEVPTRINRKLVFSKHLSLPLGEKVFYTPMNDYIHVPIFIGSNYRNKENMYLFWFQDESVLDGTTLTGNTFYMTARFFNAKDASIVNFTNKSLSPSDHVTEDEDLYYKMLIDKDDYSYQVSILNQRVGITGTPITFYETIGG